MPRTVADEEKQKLSNLPKDVSSRTGIQTGAPVF